MYNLYFEDYNGDVELEESFNSYEELMDYVNQNSDCYVGQWERSGGEEGYYLKSSDGYYEEL